MGNDDKEGRMDLKKVLERESLCLTIVKEIQGILFKHYQDLQHIESLVHILDRHNLQVDRDK